MRTYDIQSLFEYVTDCAEECNRSDESFDCCMPCVIIGKKDDGTLSELSYDGNGNYWLCLTHYSEAKGRLDDVCIKSIQRNESSILTADKVDEMTKMLGENLYNENPSSQPCPLGFVLLEISATCDGRRITDNILTTIDWFDIDGFYFDGEHESLQ